MIEEIILNNFGTNPKYAESPYKIWQMAPIQTKGTKIGENVAEYLLSRLGFNVGPREDSEHDRMIDGKKVEIKTAFEPIESNRFVFYGYNPVDNPHYWVFQFVKPDSITLIKMDRVSMAQMHLRDSKGAFMFDTTVEEMLEAGGRIIALEEE